MIVLKTLKGILLKNINDFDIDKTFDCGQCFRFNFSPDGAWHGVAGNRIITVRQTDDGVLLEGINTEQFNSFWYNYFDLDRDYTQIIKSFPSHPCLNQSIDFAFGMRILRQDSFEALISFIISQNNNVKRIKGIVGRLCQNFGQQIDENHFSFPSPIVLANQNIKSLEPLRCGWRSEYILDAARRVHCGEIDLKQVELMPLDEARQVLKTIHGVGPKVADCVLLYGMGRMEAFPLDVWMKRAMSVLFKDLTPQSFGPYAGIAQQYIFHYCRCNPSVCCTV